MQEYTVVGFYENNGQIFSHLVSARNSQHAFFVVAKEHPTATFVSAIKGRVVEGQGIEFAGDSLVDADTVVSQPEVFNRDEIEPCSSNVITDFQIQDWHLIEVGAGWTGPIEHRDKYRFVLEQSPESNRVYFKVYPSVLDGLSDEVPLNGLSGVIEIRNGKPALSLGLSENQLCLSVESDIYQGLYIHTDSFVHKSSASYFSYDHGCNFDSTYYKCEDGSFLMEARSDIADKLFDSHDFGDRVVVDSNGWDIFDREWKRTVYFENNTGGDSIKGLFELEFGDMSTVVTHISG